MKTSRRDFLCGAVSAGSLAYGATIVNAVAETPPCAAGIDPNLSVLMSDVHVPLPWSEQKYRTGREYPWIVGQIRRFVDEILAMRPLPAHVFGFGDMSIAFSEEREYEIAETLLRPLAEAGIELVMTVGNHDLREPFRKHLGKWAGVTPVPGRVASVTHLPHFDLILLDSLKEPKPEDRGKYEALTGCELGNEQRKWLEDTLEAAKRHKTDYWTAPSVYDMCFLKPLDTDILEEVAATCHSILTVEDGCLKGGLYGAVSEYFAGRGKRPVIKGLGIPDQFVEQDRQDAQRRDAGLDSESILDLLREMMKIS